MARKPRRGRAAPAEPARSPRDRIIDALMSLVAERGYARVGLADIAARAGVSMSALRAAYDGKVGILADFSRRGDEAVLAAGPAEGDTARDRLFDILMRRFDALAAHKAALKRLGQAAACDPLLGAALMRIVRRSQKWMHAAAGIEKGGITGAVAIQGGVMVYADVLRVWLDDDDPGQAKTMKRLDESLRRGEQAMRLVQNVCGMVPSFLRDGFRRRGSPDTSAPG